MKAIGKLLLLVGMAGLLLACEQISFNKREWSGVKRILLVSVQVTNQSLDEEETVKYPNLQFIGEDLRTNILAQWETRMAGRLALVPVTKLDGVRLLMDDRFIFMKGNVDPSVGDRGFGELCRAHDCQAYAVVEGGISAWGQGFDGKLQILKPGGTVIWKHQFHAVSTYIIKDEASPYLSDFDQILDTLERQRSHRTELLTVAGDLGRSTADRWHKVHEDVFGKPQPPKVTPATNR